MGEKHPEYEKGYKDGFGHGKKDGKRAERKAGGGVHDVDAKPEESYTAEPNKVETEAEKRRKGGRAERKRGGECLAEGGEAKMRADRVPRKRGGSVGSNTSPLSSAAHVTPAMGRKGVDGDIEEGD